MGVDFMEWLRRYAPKQRAPWWEYDAAWPGMARDETEQAEEKQQGESSNANLDT